MKAVSCWWITAFVLSLFSAGISAAAEVPDPVGERFHGEVLKYDFGFWIFNRVGEGTVTFRSLGHGKYFASHEGQTVGFIGWVTRYRKDIYRSTMTTVNNGRRLIPLRFEEDVIIGANVRHRFTTYDYSARRVRVETQKEGETLREEIVIPEGTVYDDPVTAFYNFRFGAYGKVEPGKEFLIHTVPREGSQKVIRMTVAPGEEAERRRSTEEKKEKKDLFVTLRVDRELVGSVHGLMEIWFSADVVPQSGVAKDVIFFGDIRGKLTDQGRIRGNSHPRAGTQTEGKNFSLPPLLPSPGMAGSATGAAAENPP